MYSCQRFDNETMQLTNYSSILQVMKLTSQRVADFQSQQPRENPCYRVGKNKCYRMLESKSHWPK